jgi:hypothetical protein
VGDLRPRGQQLFTSSSPTAPHLGTSSLRKFLPEEVVAEEEVSPGDKLKLSKEFISIDREHRGAITVQQLERLLARRAYHTRKEAWKEEQRRKNKGKNEWGGAQAEVHGASFVYSGVDNRKDRAAAMMSAKSAFQQYGIGGEGMDFRTFCQYHHQVVAKGTSSQIEEVACWDINDKPAGASPSSSLKRVFSRKSFSIDGAQGKDHTKRDIDGDPQSSGRLSFDQVSRKMSNRLGSFLRLPKTSSFSAADSDRSSKGSTVSRKMSNRLASFSANFLRLPNSSSFPVPAMDPSSNGSTSAPNSASGGV